VPNVWFGNCKHNASFLPRSTSTPPIPLFIKEGERGGLKRGEAARQGRFEKGYVISVSFAALLEIKAFYRSEM